MEKSAESAPNLQLATTEVAAHSKPITNVEALGLFVEQASESGYPKDWMVTRKPGLDLCGHVQTKNAKKCVSFLSTPLVGPHTPYLEIGMGWNGSNCDLAKIATNSVGPLFAECRSLL